MSGPFVDDGACSTREYLRCGCVICGCGKFLWPTVTGGPGRPPVHMDTPVPGCEEHPYPAAAGS